MHRFRARSPLLLLLALLCLALPAAAGRADTIDSGQDAVILEENLTVEIRSLTDARVSYEKRTRILTPKGAEDYGYGAVHYEPGMTIRDLSGAVVQPSGKRIRTGKKDTMDGPEFGSYDLYSDNRQRTIIFPGVVPGSIIEFAYELQIDNLFFLPSHVILQTFIPIQTKTLTVRHPVGFPIRLGVRGAAPEQTTEESNGVVTHRFVVRNVAPLLREVDRPPDNDLRPSISITPGEMLWDELRISATNWNDIARFYWDLARDRVVPDREVAATAAEVTVGTDDPSQKLRRVYEFVQGKVKYVSVQLGIGGWQPHPSGEVLRHRYGDCKDKATLMIAMLRSLGMTGYTVMILTRDAGLIDRDNPYPASFNHAIVAVPQEAGYMFLDPTAETTPFGDLPWMDQGATVLVVREEGRGDLTETPIAPPEHNRLQRTISASILPSGDLEGSMVLDAWGQRRVNFSSLIEARSSERDESIADLVSWLSPGARMKGQEVKKPAGPEDALRVTTAFTVPRYLTRAGGVEIVSPHAARFPRITSLAAYPLRRYPVFFDYPFQESAETRLQLPPGRTVGSLPPPNTIEGPGLRATSSYGIERNGDRSVLVVNRTITVSAREIPVDRYEDLRRFVQAVSAEEASALTLKPSD